MTAGLRLMFRELMTEYRDILTYLYLSLSHMLLPQRQDMNVSVPPQQFSFNGPPDNLLFRSVSLVWPLAQSLPQLSKKLRIYRFSQNEEAEEKKISTRLLWYHLNLEQIPRFFLFLLGKVLCLTPLTKDTILAAVVSLIWWNLYFFWLFLTLNLRSGCFQALCSHSSSVLIDYAYVECCFI